MEIQLGANVEVKEIFASFLLCQWLGECCAMLCNHFLGPKHLRLGFDKENELRTDNLDFLHVGWLGLVRPWLLIRFLVRISGKVARWLLCLFVTLSEFSLSPDVRVGEHNDLSLSLNTFMGLPLFHPCLRVSIHHCSVVIGVLLSSEANMCWFIYRLLLQNDCWFVEMWNPDQASLTLTALSRVTHECWALQVNGYCVLWSTSHDGIGGLCPHANFHASYLVSSI